MEEIRRKIMEASRLAEEAARELPEPIGSEGGDTYDDAYFALKAATHSLMDADCILFPEED